MDEYPYSGTSYYQLRQVDLDGTTTIFPAVPVILRVEAYGLFPNPIGRDGLLTLRLDEPRTAIVTFHTMEGHAVGLQRMESGEGVLNLKLSQKLPAGVYVLTVEERAQTRQYRIIVNSVE